MQKGVYVTLIIIVLILGVISFFLYEQKLQNEKNYELKKQEILNQEKEIELERQKAIDECIRIKTEIFSKEKEENMWANFWTSPKEECEEIYESKH